MTTLLIATLLFAATLKPSYTKEEVRVEYDKVVKQIHWTPDGRVEQVRSDVDNLSPSWMSTFFRENAQIIHYLNVNYFQVAYEYHKRMELAGTVPDIIADSGRLNTVMFERILPLIANHLEAHGSKIENYESLKRREIAFNRVAGNAVKFFYPDSIQPDGRIRTHICVAVNGFRGTRDVRDVMMEAFCWSAVNLNIVEDTTPLYKEFKKAERLAHDLQLSPDRQIKVKQVQGVVWAYLSQSKVLHDLLLAEYEKKKHLLTFTLKSE